MEAIIAEFEQRVGEVNSYLELLARMEDPDVVLHNRSRERQVRVFGEDSFKVMKATVFLLIYNLVESSIRSAFGRVYETIENDGKTLGDVRGDVRRLWVAQQFQPVESSGASPQKFRELAEKLLEDVLREKVVKLTPNRLPISGNLDARAIRKVCERHGVDTRSHHLAKGGVELRTVKDQRNALGHGEVTFTECGQQYAVSDLERIKRQTVVFVRSILRNVKRYLDNNAYAA